MAGKKTKKSPPPIGQSSQTGEHLHINVWIEDADNKLLFGEGRQQILEAVAEHGSLSAAAEALGMSYRGLWARIRFSEKRLGYPIIESHVGRGPSSGTSLTNQGKLLLEKYGRLRGIIESESAKAYKSIFLDK